MSPRSAMPPIHRSRWRSFAQITRSAAAQSATVRATIRPCDPPLGAHRPAGAPGEQLDDDRVVEVGDEARRAAGEPLEHYRRQFLGDDDVVLAGGGDERLDVGHPGRDQLDPRVGDRARRRRGERHVARRREHARELVGADRGAGHAGADGLGRDDEHRGPHPRSASSVRRSMPPSAHSAAP